MKVCTAHKHFRTSFYLWRRQRPLLGSLLIVISGVLVLLGPLSLIRFAFLPGSTIWMGMLVGALLCVLGVIQLLCPYYALMTGALAIICALVSLMAALGGFGIGMILGIIGGAQGVAWRSITMSRIDYQRLLDEQSASPQRGKWWQRRKNLPAPALVETGEKAIRPHALRKHDKRA